MTFIDVTENNKEEYNKVVTHPLQSYEWGEFRKKTGIKVVRRAIEKNGELIDGFTLTIHKIPKMPWNIGYLPKGNVPSKEIISELKRIGKQNNCIFIQLEPNMVISNLKFQISNLGLRPAHHPLFTKFTFVLDLTKSEDELLKAMHHKTRYNIKVAKKHNVVVTEDNSDKAFQKYMELTDETTRRQKFYAHTKQYHKIQWNTIPHDTDTTHLTSHLFTATYDKKILTTLLFFVFKDTLYYPYGASSNEHRNVMHSNLAMWEGILFGKKLGLKKFDMWGALGKDADKNNPWFGFHNFKEKFGPDHVEFIGSYDLVIGKNLYNLYKIADRIRWGILRLKARLIR